MMEWYKLYVLIHRRTDVPRLLREIQDHMYSKWYGVHRQQAKNKIVELALTMNVIHGIGGYSYW